MYEIKCHPDSKIRCCDDSIFIHIGEQTETSSVIGTKVSVLFQDDAETYWCDLPKAHHFSKHIKRYLYIHNYVFVYTRNVYSTKPGLPENTYMALSKFDGCRLSLASQEKIRPQALLHEFFILKISIFFSFLFLGWINT